MTCQDHLTVDLSDAAAGRAGVRHDSTERGMGVSLASVAGLLVFLVGPPAADASTLPAQQVSAMWVLHDISCRPDGTCLAVGQT